MEPKQTDQQEATIQLRMEDFDDLLEQAAERGAERCLAHLGLEKWPCSKRYSRAS